MLMSRCGSGVTRLKLFLLSFASYLAFVCMGCQITVDVSDFSERTRAQVFDRYWQALNDGYPFFDLAGVDWDVSREFYRPKALAASTPIDFYHCLSQMLSELDDPHVSLGLSKEMRAQTYTKPTLEWALVERSVVVVGWPLDCWVQIPPHISNVRYPVPTIMAINGMPFSTEFIELLLYGRPYSTVALTLRWPDGTITEQELQRPPYSPPRNLRLGDTTSLERKTYCVRKSGGIAYLRLDDFGVVDRLESKAKDEVYEKTLRELHQAIDEVVDSDGLIIDLQNNPGGFGGLAVQLASRLIDHREIFGVFYYKIFGIIPQNFDFIVKPRFPLYEGPIVVLINNQTTSTAEHFARFMQETGRAILIGESSIGGEAALETVFAKDGSNLRYGRWRILSKSGFGLQSVGVRPEVPIPLTLRDIYDLGYVEARRCIREARLKTAVYILSGGAELVEQCTPLEDAISGFVKN